jgi:DnaJ-class molecular chaperone
MKATTIFIKVLLYSFVSLCLYPSIVIGVHKASYYDILKVPKTADEKEIKKAYRKLAVKHHPDKGGDEEKFKEISKAYQTLSNPQDRAIYDQYGEAGLEMGAGPNAGSYSSGAGGNPFAGAQFFGGGGSGGAGSNPFQGFFSSSGGQGSQGQAFSFGSDGNIDLSEIIRQMMGGNDMGGGSKAQFSRGAQQQAQSKSYTRPIRCTLEELAQGSSKKLKLTFKGKEKIYAIPIKPGWKQGTKITYKGANGIPSMTFVVEELPHKFLRREGDNLHYTCWISESQTKGGIQVTVPLPTGEKYTRKIPKTADDAVPVLTNGEKLVIPSKGMPIKGNKENRGDLVIEFKVRRSTASRAT